MYLNDLPKECLLKIFHYLPFADVVLGVRLTCNYWYKLSFNAVLWKTVNLGDRDAASRMSDRNFLSLLHSISDSIEEIIFGHSLTISEISILHEGIHCPNLVSIDLCEIPVNSEVLEKLLNKYPKLEELFLELTPVGNYTKFLEFFRNQDFSSLKTLSVVLKLEENFEKNLYENQDFDEVLSNNPTLINLNSLLADAVVRCTALQCFAITFSHLSEETLHTILSVTKHLMHLNVAGCWHVTGKALNTLTSDNALVSLNMDNTRVNDDAIKVIAERCPRLQSISLENCLYVTDEGVKALAQYCRNITDFTLNHKVFNQDKFTNLIGVPEKEQETHPDFEKLSTNPFLRITDISIISLINNCHNLRKLGFAGCLALTDQAVEQIACSCPHLNLLNLSVCLQVTEHSVQSIFLKCRFLKILLLNNCFNVTKLTFPGARHGTSSNESSISSGKVPNVDLPPDDGNPDVVDDDGITPNSEPLAETAEEKILDGNSADVHLTLQCLHKQVLQLTVLNLNFCQQICDASLVQLAHNCPWLHKLFLRSCTRVTDSGVGAIAKLCPRLNTLDISGGSLCNGEQMQLTDNSLIELSVNSHNLSHLIVIRCLKVTVKGISAIISKCSKLRIVCVSTGLDFKISNVSLNNCLQKIEAYTSLKSIKDSNQNNVMVLKLYPYNNPR